MASMNRSTCVVLAPATSVSGMIISVTSDISACCSLERCLGVQSTAVSALHPLRTAVAALAVSAYPNIKDDVLSASLLFIIIFSLS